MIGGSAGFKRSLRRARNDVSGAGIGVAYRCAGAGVDLGTGALKERCAGAGTSGLLCESIAIASLSPFLCWVLVLSI